MTAVTASVVRAWFAEDLKRIPDGDKSVGGQNRGRLSPEALKVYLDAHKGAEYAKGTPVAKTKTVTLTVPMVDKNGRKRPAKTVEVTVADVRQLAGLTSTRGRLPASALEAAATAYAERLRAESAGKAKTRKASNGQTAESETTESETVVTETPDATGSATD